MHTKSSRANALNQIINNGVFLDALIKRAETLLQANPVDAVTLAKLAELYRQKGRLADAKRVYAELLAVDPVNPTANLMQQVLANQVVDNLLTIEPPHPVPFVQQHSFLSDAILDLVWETVESNQARFSHSHVTEGVNKNIRQSHHLDGETLNSFAPAFLKKIQQALLDVAPRLGYAPFEVAQAEIQLTMHRNGDFFKLHRDSGVQRAGEPVRPNMSRLVTFVYYFHRLPRQFTGGDLVLFDSDLTGDAHSSQYTRLDPTHNSVVFFPSSAYHQVSPIKLLSDDYRQGRFTLNGWLHPVR